MYNKWCFLSFYSGIANITGTALVQRARLSLKKWVCQFCLLPVLQVLHPNCGHCFLINIFHKNNRHVLGEWLFCAKFGSCDLYVTYSFWQQTHCHVWAADRQRLGHPSVSGAVSTFQIQRFTFV